MAHDDGRRSVTLSASRNATRLSSSTTGLWRSCSRSSATAAAGRTAPQRHEMMPWHVAHGFILRRSCILLCVSASPLPPPPSQFLSVNPRGDHRNKTKIKQFSLDPDRTLRVRAEQQHLKTYACISPWRASYILSPTVKSPPLVVVVHPPHCPPSAQHPAPLL